MHDMLASMKKHETIFRNILKDIRDVSAEARQYGARIDRIADELRSNGASADEIERETNRAAEAFEKRFKGYTRAFDFPSTLSIDIPVDAIYKKYVENAFDFCITGFRVSRLLRHAIFGFSSAFALAGGGATYSYRMMRGGTVRFRKCIGWHVS
jgi:hypothetical protein